MTIDTDFQQALRGPDRVAELRRLAQRWLDEGQTPTAVLSRFKKLREQLRTAGREDEEDAVMDVMDFLTGWCSPHVKLPSEAASKHPEE